jgi:molybdopterin-guanine dinucleotide biosynthesis protein A
MAEPSPFTAFVLAGGKSTRMGSDKALMRLGGRPLILRALELAEAVTKDVKIVGDPEKFATFGKVVQDIYAARGPLGGIHAALRHSTTEYNLILGVDLPFVPASFLSFLVSATKSSEATVTVPSAGGYLQTLCAIYRKTFVEPAEAALAAGRNKIDALFSNISIRVVDEQETSAAGFNTSMFRNLNTPQDWEAAKREFETRPQHL